MNRSFQSAFLSYVSSESPEGESNQKEPSLDSSGTSAESGDAKQVTAGETEGAAGVTYATRRSGRISLTDSAPSPTSSSSIRQTRASSRTSSPNPESLPSTSRRVVPSTSSSSLSSSTTSERIQTRRSRMKDLDPDTGSASVSENEKETTGGQEIDLEKSPPRQKYRNPVISPRTKRLVKASKVDKTDKKFLKPAVVCLGKKVKMKRADPNLNTPSKHAHRTDLSRKKKKLLKMCGKLKQSAKKRMKLKSRDGEEKVSTLSLLHRPKRVVKMPRSLEYTAALSRKEERELKKALYASLQETKRSSNPGGISYPESAACSSSSSPHLGGHLMAGHHLLEKKLKKSGLKLMMPPAQIPGAADSNLDSNRSSSTSTASSINPDRKNIAPRPISIGGKSPLRAQRKFAEGSRPCSPSNAGGAPSGSASSTPSKSKPQSASNTPTHKILNPNKRAKTEDFLTFLCLRGSHFLPPHLDFFNYCETESLPSFPGTPHQSQDGSRPATPQSSSTATVGVGGETPHNGHNGSTKDVTPALSRASSPDHEIQMEISDLGVRPLPPAVSSSSSPFKSQRISSPSVKVKGSKKSTSSKDKKRDKSHKSHHDTKPHGSKKSHSTLSKKPTSHHQQSKFLKVPKVKGRGHAEGQGIIEVDDEIEIVMPEKRSLSMKYVPTSSRTCIIRGSTSRNEARKRLVRKAKSHVSRAVERRKLRSDTRREQDYELAVAQGFAADSSDDTIIVTPGDEETVRVKRKRGRPRTRPDSKSHKTSSSKSKSKLSAKERKHKIRKSVRDLLEEAHHGSSPVEQSPDKSESSPEKSHSKKTGKSPHKRSHSLEPSSGKKIKSSVDKALRSPLKEKKHKDRKTEVASSQAVVPSTSGGSSKKSREAGLDQQRPSISSGVVASAGKMLRSPSGKKSLSAPQPAPGPQSDPIIITGAVREPFPSPTEPARTMDVPTYHPSAEQFQDPISYIESIQLDAESFGICCIVPPDGWKPECKISEDLRFTTQVQHINKMQDRWGSNVFQLECIKKHLESQGIYIENIPLVGGIELDLPALAAAIRSCGGLQSVIDRNKWLKVADQLRIPKVAQDRTTRLYDAYCKYLLSYDTLSEAEKSKIKAQVQADKKKKSQVWDQGCVSRGKSKTLSDFFRVARNTWSVYFPNEEPSVSQVEEDYWHLVQDKSQHVSIQTAHVDTKLCGSAFPTKKESPYSRHGWNFHILQHNNGSVLKYAGQVSGVSVPTLHIGMLFSTNCLSRNMHLLPYISYLHSGADIIWYAIPKSEEEKLKKVLEELVPDLINIEDPLWLPEDSVMVCPQTLQEKGISMCRKVQRQGEFMVVLPQTFTATISTGYNIGESIHFATADWLPLGVQAAKLLQSSGEPEMFSMDRLFVTLARSEKASNEQLRAVLPYLQKLVDKECQYRKKLKDNGLKVGCRMSSVVSVSPSGKRRHQHSYEALEDEENRCEAYKRICYLSKVVNEQDDLVHSLEYAASEMSKKQLRSCKLMYRFEESELKAIIEKVEERLSGSTTPPKKKGPRLKRASHPL